MKNSYFKFLILCFISTGSYANSSFECGFLQEKAPGGKSNKATCTMNPEITFSSSIYKHNAYDHCQVDKVYVYEDLTSFNVSKEIITWKKKYGLVDRAKKRQKKRYLSEGRTEEKANKLVNTTRTTNHVYLVKNYTEGYSDIYENSLTGEFYDPPKKGKTHLYTFGEYGRTFSLYIPEENGKAILTEYTTIEDASWVSLRFGTCRKLK